LIRHFLNPGRDLRKNRIEIDVKDLTVILELEFKKFLHEVLHMFQLSVFAEFSKKMSEMIEEKILIK